jgi:hypothetical protein
MYLKLSEFRRIGIWQILLMVLCFYLQYSRVVFGTSLNKETSFEERCGAIFGSNAALDILEKGATVTTEVINLWPWLGVLFTFHLIEYFVFGEYEEFLRIVNGDKMPDFKFCGYSASEEEDYKEEAVELKEEDMKLRSLAIDEKKLEEMEKKANVEPTCCGARLTLEGEESSVFIWNARLVIWTLYWCFWFVRSLISTIIFCYAAKFQICQPFLGVCLYQDYFITLLRQIWVVIETRIKQNGLKDVVSSVFRKSFLEAKRHFWRMHFIIRDGDIPDAGFGFSDENEDGPLPVLAPQEKREEQVKEKLKK